MQLNRFQSGMREYLYILLGTACMAIAIKSVYDVMGLVTGGFTGISIMIKGMSEAYIGKGIPLWFTNTILNIPLFLVAIHKKGLRFLWKSLFGMLLLSAWLYVIPSFELIKGDILLTAVFGGLMTGVGIGMVLRAGATTGGVDLLATLLHSAKPRYSVVQMMQVIDAAIILLGAYIFGVNRALYAILAVFVTTRISDTIIEGWKSAKFVYIISEKYKEVSDVVMNQLQRGITALEGKGMYSGNTKSVLFCVVSRKEIVHLKEIIYQVDESAFVIVTDVREVLGEGFVEG